MEDTMQFPDIEGYKVSIRGDVFSLKRNKKLKLQTSKSGYTYAYLMVSGKLKGYLVHRLVAMAFVPNPENKSQVSHKDGNKENNHASNLQWGTHKEIINHAIKIGLINPGANNPNGRGKGFIVSKTTKKLMSLQKIGRKHPKFNGYYITPFGIFESSYAAAKMINVSHRCIQYRCKSDNYPEYYISNRLKHISSELSHV